MAGPSGRPRGHSIRGESCSRAEGVSGRREFVDPQRSVLMKSQRGGRRVRGVQRPGYLVNKTRGRWAPSLSGLGRRLALWIPAGRTSSRLSSEEPKGGPLLQRPTGRRKPCLHGPSQSHLRTPKHHLGWAFEVCLRVTFCADKQTAGVLFLLASSVPTGALPIKSILRFHRCCVYKQK